MTRFTRLIALYAVLLFVYSGASYILTDPNLVLTTWQPYWQWQQFLWQQLLPQSLWLTVGYLILVILLFVTYNFLITAVARLPSISLTRVLLVSSLFAIPVLFSYNALSHDVFNYIFNARMIISYGVNPHEVTALAFPVDPWTRFMHNTHTAAPYGYGWTMLSLLPYLAGFQKFILTWFSFKLFSLLSFLGVLRVLYGLIEQKADKWRIFLFALNPLVLIEVLSNAHNDLWMLLPALGSYALLRRFLIRKKFVEKAGLLAGAIVLLALSISIKLATLVLVPLSAWLLLLHTGWPAGLERQLRFPQYFQVLSADWFAKQMPFFAAIALFLPLLTEQSKQFLPWYLLWSLVWVPLISQTWLRLVLIAFSVGAMLRYIPWLLAGFEYSDAILAQQRWITWGLSGGLAILLLVIQQRYNKR